MRLGSMEFRSCNGLTRRVGQRWENGKNTWQISLLLGKPEAVVERHLHEYLHWKRVDNPALRGAILRTGDEHASEAKAEVDSSPSEPNAMGEGKHNLSTVVLPQ
jgi:hypothetical protein